MLFYNYHIHAQLPHNTCKPVYMAYDNSDVVNWENMEKCTYNTERTCSENSIEIAQEKYEHTALGKLKKKERKTSKQMIKPILYWSQRRKWK